VRMQGAHVADSFTVAIAGADGADAAAERAHHAWERVVSGLDVPR